MPHDFRNGSSAAGPSRTSGTFAPNVNSAADAALLAHAKRFNPVKMTAETRASYAAFCGITDNKVAAHLHKHYVTADDVNDYCKHGIGTRAFQTMAHLSLAGVTPAIYQMWSALPFQPATISACHTANLTPGDVKPWIRAIACNNVSLTYHDIPKMTLAGLTPMLVAAYQSAGMIPPDTIIALHERGVTPEVITMNKTRVARWEHSKFYLKALRASQLCQDVALTQAVLRLGLDVDAIVDWVATGLPAHRIALYVNAGVGPFEATSADLINADPDALRSLAALLSTGVPVNDLAFA